MVSTKKPLHPLGENTKHKTQNTKHKTQNTKHKRQKTKDKRQKTKDNHIPFIHNQTLLHL